MEVINEMTNDKKLLSWGGEAKKPRLCTVTKIFTTYGIFRFPLPMSDLKEL